jgi:hypothetical protein
MNSSELLNPMVTQSNFKFSAVDVDDLTSSEYTLVNIAIDLSSSVYGYYDDLIKTIETIIDACKKSDRAENLMVRVTYFNSSVQEFHGFKTLYSLTKDDYNGLPNPSGMTALYDGTIDAIESVEQYGKTLTEQEFEVNGILFILTDGVENNSNNSCSAVVDKFKQLKYNESLESLQSFLIGVNTNDNYVKDFLDNFNKEVDFDEFVSIENATTESLSKLARFVSKSISLQSQALGTGGASQQIATF